MNSVGSDDLQIPLTILRNIEACFFKTLNPKLQDLVPRPLSPSWRLFFAANCLVIDTQCRGALEDAKTSFHQCCSVCGTE